MNSFKRNFLTALLSTTLLITPMKSSEAALVGLATGNFVLAGWAFAGGLGSFSMILVIDNNDVQGGFMFGMLGIMGLILDESSKNFDITHVTPESLALAYDEATSKRIWSDLQHLDLKLDKQEFKFEIPKTVMEFTTTDIELTSNFKKQLKASEKTWIEATSLALVNGVKKVDPKSEFKPDAQTTAFILENLTGYTFLGAAK